MTRANRSSDRAAARQRAKIEAESITSQQDLTTVEVARVLRAHRGGEEVSLDPSSESPRRPRVAPQHGDHLIPQRDDIDLSDIAVRHIGTILAGVQDFKILRGQTVTVSLTTSTEYAHRLVDAAVISRASVLVADLYEIPRMFAFGADDDDD